MSETLIEKLTKTPEGMRLYQQERAIQELTDMTCEIMHEQDVSRSELARRLGKTKGYITQLLDGRANMTVRTISDIFTALDRAVHFQEGPLSATVSTGPTISLVTGMDWLPKEASCPMYEFDMGAPTTIQGKLAS